MEFLKKMKSREILEMSLKTVAAVIVGLILIILMEGMIYSIHMNKVNENTSTQYVVSECVAYAEETTDGKYKVYLHNQSADSWCVLAINQSAEQIRTAGYKKCEFRTPNAFDLSISGVHYVVMAVFIVAILGLYGYRFYRLHCEYVKFEKKQKNGINIFS